MSSNKRRDGGPAFPFVDQSNGSEGMSYHDVAALMAMQSIVGSVFSDRYSVARMAEMSADEIRVHLSQISTIAHMQADTMLAERERREKNE